MTGDERRGDAVQILERELGLLLRRVRRGIGERAIAVHPDLNPSSYALMLTLVDFGPCRAADLADLFSLDKGAVSRLVRQLEEIGFVERTPDPHDGRASILAATAVALDRFEAMKADRSREFGAKLAGWPADDIEALAQGLVRFNETLSS